MDALEIIRQMEGDPGLRAQMRAVLLGDELLELPALVRRLAEAQARTEEQLRSFQEATERSFQAVERRFQGVDDRFQGVDSRLETIERDVAELKTDVGGLRNDVADLKGRSVEDRLRANPRRYLHPPIARGVRLLDGDEFDEMFAGLDSDESIEVGRADALLAAKLRDGRAVVFVAEAAAAAHADDVERAVHRAELLRAAGVDARALVVSQRPPAQVVIERAERLGAVLVVESAGVVVPPAA